MFQGLQTLPDKVSSLVFGEHAHSLELSIQLAALAVLHDKVHVLVVEIRLIERANVRMVHGQQNIQLSLQRRQVLLNLDPLDRLYCILFLHVSGLMRQASRPKIA